MSLRSEGTDIVIVVVAIIVVIVVVDVDLLLYLFIYPAVAVNFQSLLTIVILFPGKCTGRDKAVCRCLKSGSFPSDRVIRCAIHLVASFDNRCVELICVVDRGRSRGVGDGCRGGHSRNCENHEVEHRRQRNTVFIRLYSLYRYHGSVRVCMTE